MVEYSSTCTRPINVSDFPPPSDLISVVILTIDPLVAKGGPSPHLRFKRLRPA